MRFPAAPPPFHLDLIKDAIARAPEHVRPDLPDGRYLHWDQLRRRPPPTGLTSAEWWAATKLARRVGAVAIPGFFSTGGQQFAFCGRIDALSRATHELDRRDVAREVIACMGDDDARADYQLDLLIEEAISSSLIEGATISTRAHAKAMVRERRNPATRSERMIYNNYLAMERILAIANRALTVDDLLELHAILGADALDVAGAEGRLRTTTESVVVEDATTGEVWHTPPPAEELPERLRAMLEFANDDGGGEPFVHPLVRAMVLHFWVGYLHPFVDGNGRIARALFYWRMLRAKYELAQFLSISGPIDRSKRQYYLAFAYSETDDADLTYFLLNQVAVLRSATDELLAHLRDRTERLRTMQNAVAETALLNHRQRAVLQYLVRHPVDAIEIGGHRTQHRVSYLTARKDLQDLEAAGFLSRVRVGRTDRYLIDPAFAARYGGRISQ